MAPLLKATSDADGNYRISEVPAGFYRVVPMAPDYIVPEVNQVSFGSRGKALHVAEGEMVDDVDFSIARGAVITGKVSYSDGRPVVEERVVAMSARQVDPGSPIFFQGLPFQTDDRGVYRIYGLAAGQYKLSVGQPADGLYTTVGRSRPALERVFHPDVSDVNEAKVIELAEGGEATNIDITVSKTLRGFTAAGLIIDGETNQPVPNVRFGLQRMMGQQRSFVSTNASSDQRGEFRLENILPGKYSLIILPTNNQAQADPVAFEVVDQDIAGITVRTSKGASLAGLVVLEGGADKSVWARLLQLRFQVYVYNEGNPAGGYQSSTINPDGTFRVGGLKAGTASFSLANQDYSPPKGFSLARVEQDGVAQPRGLKINAGEQVSGVRVVFNYATGVVRGNVNIVNGPLPIGARVMVRLAKVGEPSSSLRPQEADSRGYFIIEGVPGGSYDLHVSTFIAGARQRPPSAKQSVSVADGAVTEVVVSLDLNPPRDSAPNP
ncbi:MAG: hypothetical protein H7Z16_07530 [Pyrinomonadaceae bacterium]|nr:hypothetical protein [Pyrinomonadaceae bacterium]